jgi:hypothetical protein
VNLNLVARALGEDLLAGCPVQPVPPPATASAPGVGHGGAENPFEGYDGPCYVALGPSRIVVFEYQPGAFSFAPGRALATYALRDLASCEYWPARTGGSRLPVTTRTGLACDLMIALAHRGTGHRISAAIDQHLRSNAA